MFSGTNQKPERRRPFGTGLVRHCPQGLFSPFFTFLRAIYFPARLDFSSSPLSAPGSPRMRSGGNKLSNVKSLVIILQSGEGSSSFNNDNSANFSGEKKYNEEFRGVCFFDNTRKNFKSSLVLVVVFVLESKGL